MMKHMGFAVLAVGLVACGSDDNGGSNNNGGNGDGGNGDGGNRSGEGDYNAADLMRAEQGFAEESCACAGSESQACLDDVGEVTLTDCQLDAIMGEIEMAQDLVNCLVELYDEGIECVKSSECEVNSVVTCSDMVVDGVDECPMSTPAVEQAFEACG